MKSKLFNASIFILLSLLLMLFSACSREETGDNPTESGHGSPALGYERGPHGGRLLNDGVFTLELAIFETGVPPEFRVWASSAGKAISPSDVNLEVRLTRLGNHVDTIGFQPQDDFLRGDQVIYEPHSFMVSIDARVGGAAHRWEYDNFEGRTRISDSVAEAFELETDIAGPARIRQVIDVYGSVEPNADRVSIVSARFDGLIQSVHASLGEAVTAGQPMLTIESDASLKPYQVKAPISGIVTERNANVGEPTAGRRLFTIIDPSSVWVNLAIFPSNLPQVQVGALVSIDSIGGNSKATGTIDRMSIVADSNQAVMARVVLDNSEGQFFPGSKIRGRIQVAVYDVPLAVKRDGLQSFRDFTVVFAKVGDEYEVRMLELGQQDDEWIEVLGGLDPGTRYVTNNSYLVKADIEKSGASHDH
jgi:cobalt-zinc-cadmium efflux system membrane fusion protein